MSNRVSSQTSTMRRYPETFLFFFFVQQVGALWSYGETVVVCTRAQHGFVVDEDGEIPSLLKKVENGSVIVKDDVDIFGFDSYQRKLLFESVNINYEVRLLGTFTEVVVRTRNGECDIGWNNYFAKSYRDQCTYSSSDTCKEFNETILNSDGTIIDPSPREIEGNSYQCCVDFGTNYFPLGMSLLYYHPSNEKSSSQAILDAIFSTSMGNACGLIATFVIAAGHIIWYLERDHSDMFHDEYLDGLGDGLWFCVVTLTTVGYGDITPQSTAGRIFGVIWMFMGLIVCGVFLGAISSAIAVSSSNRNSVAVSSWEDYSSICADSDANCKVCTYTSAAEDIEFVKESNNMDVDVVVGADFDECVSMMMAHEITSVFMESPVISTGIEAYPDLADKATISAPFYYVDNSLIFPDLVNLQKAENITGCHNVNNTLFWVMNNALMQHKVNDRLEREDAIKAYLGDASLMGSEVVGGGGSGSQRGLNYWLISPPLILLAIYASTVLVRNARRAKDQLNKIKSPPAMLNLVKTAVKIDKLEKKKGDHQMPQTEEILSLGSKIDKLEAKFHSLESKLDHLIAAVLAKDTKSIEHVDPRGSQDNKMQPPPSDSQISAAKISLKPLKKLLPPERPPLPNIQNGKSGN